MAYSKTTVPASVLAARGATPDGRAMAASAGRKVQQGPENYAGRATVNRSTLADRAPVARRPRPVAQPYQPADRAFARGAGPAPAPPPPPRAPGGAGNTGTVRAPGPGQTNTPTHGPGHVAGPAPAAAYNGMMRGNINKLSLADALGNAGQSSQPLTRWEGGSRNRDNPVEVIPQQPLTSSASVLGGTPANMAVGGAGTAQGSVQSFVTPSQLADRAADAARAEGVEINPNNWRAGNGSTVGDHSDAAGDQLRQWGIDPSRSPFWDTKQFVAEHLPGGGGGGSDASTPFGKILQDIIGVAGNDLSGATDKMNANDMGQIDEHFGESSSAYRDIMNMARSASDPEEQRRVEEAARGDLYTGINQQRDEAQRQMLASAGRGGYQSSGAQTGIYNAAMQAAQAGERGLTQDAFGRRQAATQLGMSGLGAGGSALENLLQSGFTSNKELMAMLLGGGKQLKSYINPFDTVNL